MKNKNRNPLTAVLLAGAFCLGTYTAQAETPTKDAVALQSWAAISALESKHGIPRGLLHSMSLVETGQSLGGTLLPWPYTIHVNASKTYDYTTATAARQKLETLTALGFKRFDLTIDGKKHKKLKAEEVTTHLSTATSTTFGLKAHGYAKRFGSAKSGAKHVNALIKQGYKNVDVGVMQINWYYHGQHFKSVEEAFDPAINASYAVSYLSQHREKRDWWNSVGRYHSGTQKHAKRYIQSVYTMYRRVHRIGS